jgi:hypothetical protein
MFPLSYVVLGALMAVPISLALGRGWLRQGALVLAGFALFGANYVVALAVGCPPDARECAPELALVVGGFVLAGWLAGIGLAALIRLLRRRRVRARSVLALAAGLLVVLSVAVYGRYGYDVWRWGCPSQAELEAPRSPSEVTRAFADAGLPLARAPWPPELWDARAYRGSIAFRHEADGATLHVIVCGTPCRISQQTRPGSPRERFRFGIDLGNNVVAWIAGEPRAALDAGVDPDSRCYVG